MFHIELRQAPHSLHRFNLSEDELRTGVLEPWVRGQQIEMGERSWAGQAGKILVLEGPEIPIGQLTMGRGWAVAQREGTNVTERMLRSVSEALRAAAPAQAGVAMATDGSTPGPPSTIIQAASQIAPVDAEVLADALGLELLRELGDTPMSLLSAWRIAARRHPQLPPGIALDLAAKAVASLVRSHLVRLDPARSQETASTSENFSAALSVIDSWTEESGPSTLRIHRT